MKKSDYILIGVTLLVIIVSIFGIKGTKAAEDVTKEKVTLSGEASLTEINYIDYEGLQNSGEPFLVIIERTGCHYCELYMPIAEEVASTKNISIKYIDIANLSEEEFNNLTNSNSYFKKNQEWGTPTTLLLKGSEVIDSISGYVEKDKLETFIDDNIILG